MKGDTPPEINVTVTLPPGKSIGVMRQRKFGPFPSFKELHGEDAEPGYQFRIVVDESATVQIRPGTEFSIEPAPKDPDDGRRGPESYTTTPILPRP
jgi:hypothetical protein